MSYQACALGHVIPTGSKFCSICGGVALNAFCVSGHAMPADARYCGQCGGGIQAISSAVPHVTTGNYSPFHVWKEGIRQDLKAADQVRLAVAIAALVLLAILGTALLAHGQAVLGVLSWLPLLGSVVWVIGRAGPCPGCGDRIHRQETGRRVLSREPGLRTRTVTEQRHYQHSGSPYGETVDVTREETYAVIVTTYLINFRCPACGYQSTGTAFEETPA